MYKQLNFLKNVVVTYQHHLNYYLFNPSINGIVPNIWKYGLIPIYKKGEIKDDENYVEQ